MVGVYSRRKAVRQIGRREDLCAPTRGRLNTSGFSSAKKKYRRFDERLTVDSSDINGSCREVINTLIRLIRI
jgi:hypothetical protein